MMSTGFLVGGRRRGYMVSGFSRTRRTPDVPDAPASVGADSLRVALPAGALIAGARIYPLITDKSVR